jgi:hypothetical protein
MSKKPMPTEEEVRDYFQRAYYLVPIHSEGETVYQYDWIGPMPQPCRRCWMRQGRQGASITGQYTINQMRTAYVTISPSYRRDGND